MKVIFLDFDGVLNSYQEVVYKRLRQRWSLSDKILEKLGEALLHLCHKLKYDIPHRNVKDRFVNWLSSVALFRIVDHAEFCPIACSNIQHILDNNPDVRLVISSTWRGGGMAQMRYILTRNHIDASKCIDITGYGKGRDANGAVGTGVRGHQIQEWLNNKAHLWDVEKFAIIDDDGDMDHLMPYLVNTDAKNGFTWTDLEKTVGLLDGQFYDKEENKRLKRWGAMGMLTGRM